MTTAITTYEGPIGYSIELPKLTKNVWVSYRKVRIHETGVPGEQSIQIGRDEHTIAELRMGSGSKFAVEVTDWYKADESDDEAERQKTYVLVGVAKKQTSMSAMGITVRFGGN
jgi:hypothetical protein